MNEFKLYATEKQLKERWLTPEGKKVKKQVIDHITEDNWERLLIRFTYVKELENGRDLRFINLSKTNIIGASLKKANLWGANLSETRLTGADLTGANLWRANLSKSMLSEAKLSKVNLSEANLVGCYLKEANLSKANLIGANLTGAILWNADLSGTELCMTDFSKVEPQMADFNKANILGTIFNEINLYNTNFRNCSLKDVEFNKCNLNNADFSNCLLNNIKFKDCSIDEITFKFAVITNVDWTNLNIRRKYFEDLRSCEDIGDKKNYYELKETYLNLKNKFRKNGRYNDMSWAYLKEKESLRLAYKQKIIDKNVSVFIRIKNSFKFLWEYFLFLLFGYGEKPWYILGWSILTILVFGIFYKITNAIGSNFQDIKSDLTFLRSIYFSTITFTTVGFGDFRPISDISRVLVMIEASLGLFFYSLFVFTFGRRIAGR